MISAIETHTPSFRFKSFEEAVTCAEEITKQLNEAALTARANGKPMKDQDFEEMRLELRPANSNLESHLLLLGGMGPQAGLEGFIQACQILEDRRAITLIQATRVPDRTEAIEAWLNRQDSEAIRGVTDSMAAVLVRDGQRLQLSGRETDCILLCNAAHYFIGKVDEQLRSHDIRLSWHFLPDAAATRAKEEGAQKVLVFCTNGTRLTRLYGAALKALDIEAQYPSEALQELLMRCIYKGVKAMNPAVTAELSAELAERLAVEHPEIRFAIAGCTEVPTVLSQATLRASSKAGIWLKTLRTIDPVREALLRLRETCE